MEINRNAPVWAELDIEIAAPIEAVWDVLQDVDAWGHWLSIGKAAGLEGPLAPGTRLWMKPNGVPGTIRVTIDAVEEPHVLAWSSRNFGIFAIRSWRLESIEGGTRVHTAESADGPVIRLLRRPLTKVTASVMPKWLDGLKTEAQRRTPRDSNERNTMAVKLHRCPVEFMKISKHPCWKVEKALIDMGIDYETVPGPLSKSKRTRITQATGQNKYPAIEFEDGSWYREESADMERTIRAGRLDEHRGQA